MDTGSEASLIKESIVNKHPQLQNNIVKIPRISLIGANSKKMYEVNKLINIPVEIENIILNLELLIVPVLENDIVLGNDELDKNKVIINYIKKNLNIQGKNINFKK